MGEGVCHEVGFSQAKEEFSSRALRRPHEGRHRGPEGWTKEEEKYV